MVISEVLKITYNIKVALCHIRGHTLFFKNFYILIMLAVIHSFDKIRI